MAMASTDGGSKVSPIVLSLSSSYMPHMPRRHLHMESLLASRLRARHNLLENMKLATLKNYFIVHCDFAFLASQDALEVMRVTE